MKKTFWDYVDGTQLRTLGMAVMAAFFYWKADVLFKDRIGKAAYDNLNSWLVYTVVILFIASGWQAVSFLAKNAAKFKLERIDPEEKKNK